MTKEGIEEIAKKIISPEFTAKSEKYRFHYIVGLISRINSMAERRGIRKALEHIKGD